MKKNLKEYKKRNFICYDDNGKKIYSGDIVELHNPLETRNSYQSVVYWNMLDGAFVEGHPSHKSLNGKNRSLTDYLGRQDRSCWEYHDDGREEWVVKTTKCVKIKSFYND